MSRNFPECYDVLWTSPSRNSSESMPCGGHDIGLNVWVEDGDLLLYVDRSGNIDENDQQLKSGRMRLRLDPNPFIAPVAFTQRLRLSSGAIEITAGPEGRQNFIRVWVEVHRPIVHIDMRSEMPTIATAVYESWRLKTVIIPRTLDEQGNIAGWDFNRWSMYGYFTYAGEIRSYADRVAFAGNQVQFYHANGDDLIFDKEVRLMRIDPAVHPLAHPTRGRIFGGMLAGDGMLAAGTGDGIYCQTPFRGWQLRSQAPSHEHHVRLTLHTSQGQPQQQWCETLKELVHACLTHDAQAWQQNIQWWAEFWARSHIIVNPDAGADDVGWQIGRNYNLMRFMLACNTHGEWPTRFNGGLFTFDPVYVREHRGDASYFNPDFRAWGAWTAQNQRLLYWPLLKSGDFDLMRPQFEFYRKNMPNAIARTRSAWNIDGCSFCEQIGSGALPLGSHYGWEPPYGKRDPNKEAGLSEAHATYYTTQLEFTYMIHEWARYCGGDLTAYIDFLKQSVVLHFTYFPMLHRRRTGSDWDENGHLVIDPGHALETYHGRNPTDVICALRFNLESLLRLQPPLVSAAERASFADWLHRLPEINYRTRQGRRTISPIANGDNAVMGNVELPQLYPVFPWPMFGLGRQNLEVAIDTWRHGHDEWTHTWYAAGEKYPARDQWMGWMQQAIFLARLGLVEEVKPYIIKKLADARVGNEFESPSRMRFPAFWGPGFDWTPDMNWGGSGMIALQEMLLQIVDDRALVLPTWPKEWAVEFRLHAPGGAIIECQYRPGAAVTAQCIRGHLNIQTA